MLSIFVFLKTVSILGGQVMKSFCELKIMFASYFAIPLFGIKNKSSGKFKLDCAR